jgi:hypothetical protein
MVDAGECFTVNVSPRTRSRVLAVATLAVIGVALPVGTVALLWYLPVARTWWSLAIFVAALVLPIAVGLVGGRQLRRALR